MKPKKIITALSAGVALAVATGCSRADTQGPTENPPAPAEQPEQPVLPEEPTPGDGSGVLERTVNPPPPLVLPTWEQVVRPAPEPGADRAPVRRTNPPSPALIVAPDGRCYVRWEDPRGRIGDRVEQDAGSMGGTEIQCPEKAHALLDAWKARQP